MHQGRQRVLAHQGPGGSRQLIIGDRLRHGLVAVQRTQVGEQGMAAVEQSQLGLLPWRDVVGEDRTSQLPRWAGGGEVVGQNPLPKRFRHDQPPVLDPEEGLRLTQVGRRRRRHDPIDHA